MRARGRRMISRNLVGTSHGPRDSAEDAEDAGLRRVGALSPHHPGGEGERRQVQKCPGLGKRGRSECGLQLCRAGVGRRQAQDNAAVCFGHVTLGHTHPRRAAEPLALWSAQGRGLRSCWGSILCILSVISPRYCSLHDGTAGAPLGAGRVHPPSALGRCAGEEAPVCPEAVRGRLSAELASPRQSPPTVCVVSRGLRSPGWLNALQFLTTGSQRDWSRGPCGRCWTAGPSAGSCRDRQALYTRDFARGI